MALPVNTYTPLTFEQANPFLTGANEAMKYLSNALAAPYSGKLADAEIKQKLADAALNNFYLNNPLLKLTGNAGQVGALAFLMQNPSLNNLYGGNSEGNPDLGSGTGAPTTTLTPPSSIAKPSPTLSTGGPVGNPGFTNKGFNTSYKSPYENNPSAEPKLPMAGAQLDRLKTLYGQAGINGATLSDGSPATQTNASSASNQSSLQTAPSSGSPTMQKPKTFSDLLSGMLSTQQNNQTARADLYRKQTNGFEWMHAPQEVKDQAIAQLAGAGIDPTEANARLAGGEKVPDILRSAGFDPNNPPQPDYLATKQNITKLKERQAALKSMGILSQHIQEGLGPYIRTVGGYSPAQILDAMRGMNKTQQQMFLAALMAQQDLAMYRINVAGGRVTRGGIQEMLEASMGHIKPIKAQISPDVYVGSQKMLDSWLNQMADASNSAMTQIKVQPTFDESQSGSGSLQTNNSSNYTPPSGMAVVIGNTPQNKGKRFLVPVARQSVYVNSGQYIAG